MAGLSSMLTATIKKSAIKYNGLAFGAIIIDMNKYVNTAQVAEILSCQP